MRDSRTKSDIDIVVAGGGSAGLAFALAVKRSAPSLEVEVVDRAAPSNGAGAEGDLRASAIAGGARRMLATLGVWQEIADEAQPILRMSVTDSRTGDAVRPVFLTFDGPARDGEPFAHMVPNTRLASALLAAARQAGVKLTRGGGVSGFVAGQTDVSVILADGETRHARLLVAADGVRSRLRDAAGIKTVSWRYPQAAIVTTIALERPHEGLAIEHFLPSGPFAMLPLTQNRASLVWTEKEARAKEILAGPQALALAEIEQRIGHRFGRIELVAPLASYPLGLLLVRRFVATRFALLGDAAHGIHPIAGQGLNLGFKDAAALAESVVEAYRIGMDVGSADVLQRYERWRRFDTWQMGAATDVLNRLFSNDIPGLRTLRDAGLAVADRLPRLKRFFIAEAAGEAGEMPRLMAGEPL